MIVPPAPPYPTCLPVHPYLSVETRSLGERRDSAYTHLLQTLYSLPTVPPHAHPLYLTHLTQGGDQVSLFEI